MPRSRAVRAWLSLTLTTVLSACGQSPAPTEVNDADYPGIGQASFPLLAAACVVTSAGVTVSVNDAETALVTLNPSGNLMLNTTRADGSPCEAPANANITITPGTSGERGVYLDFSKGLFSTATTATPKISINLGVGGSDKLSVRGSASADHFYFGRGRTAGTYALNFNGGSGAGLDALVDVHIAGVEQVMVSSGPGADILDGSGLFGTLGPFPAPLALFGGADDDVLLGGAGNDTLSGDPGSDRLSGAAGANSYAGGIANDGSDIITVATGALDIIDYSERFNSVSVLLNNAPVSGEVGESDTIPDAVSIVVGGAGNDTLSAAGSTRKHTLRGGPGNDTLIGGDGGDILVGGDGVSAVDGDDVFIGNKATADYSGYGNAVTITINGAGSGGADANDGDPRAVRSVQPATQAADGATIEAATNTVTGLKNMNAGSVGRRLTIAGSAGAANDGAYRIAAVTSATTVVLHSADTALNPTWADDRSASWTFAEDAGPEKDEVRCRHVIGSATVTNTITGDANDNQLTGGAVSDTLSGGGGADWLVGLGGDDALYGGAGQDSLFGGAGRDSLYGGDGEDVLEGDDETDTFRCDGPNAIGVPGTAPGTVDFTVDYTPDAPDNDVRAQPSDCEF